MRRGVAVLLLGASVVRGVGLGVGVDAVTSDRRPRAAAAVGVPTPAKVGVEVKNPVLVSNADGGATLSATLINHTTGALDINSVVGGQEDDIEAPQMLVYADRSTTWLEPGKQTSIGEESTGFRIQFRSRVQVGSTLPLTLAFAAHAAPWVQPIYVTVRAPVVRRTTAHETIADSDRNSAVRVNDPVIVVVPGQQKAYVGGYITATVRDTSFELPTAVDSRGGPVQWRHETATGGPFGVFAVPGKRSYFRELPYPDDDRRRYLEHRQQGTADYFRASDVTIGEQITVTMRFPSGDVVTKFMVVQAAPDGTI